MPFRGPNGVSVHAFRGHDGHDPAAGHSSGAKPHRECRCTLEMLLCAEVSKRVYKPSTIVQMDRLHLSLEPTPQAVVAGAPKTKISRSQARESSHAPRRGLPMGFASSGAASSSCLRPSRP